MSIFDMDMPKWVIMAFLSYFLFFSTGPFNILKLVGIEGSTKTAIPANTTNIEIFNNEYRPDNYGKTSGSSFFVYLGLVMVVSYLLYFLISSLLANKRKNDKNKKSDDELEEQRKQILKRHEELMKKGGPK